jgi:predicted acetyltransferase
MAELIEPTVRLYAAWRAAHEEWGPGLHEDGFGLGTDDDVDSHVGFATWVAQLNTGAGVYRWIVEDGQVLGGIVLRPKENEYVRWAGHLGYGVRPSARRRGLAGWAVGRMLDEARLRGMARVLVVCAAENVASRKTIERCGGVFECLADTGFGPVRRYWIEL